MKTTLGGKPCWVTLTPEAELKLDELARQYPEKDLEELLAILSLAKK